MYYYIGKIIFYNPQDIFFKPFTGRGSGTGVKSPEQEGCLPSVSQREGFFADNPAFLIENEQAR